LHLRKRFNLDYALEFVVDFPIHISGSRRKLRKVSPGKLRVEFFCRIELSTAGCWDMA
jgi:hypothetical protein